MYPDPPKPIIEKADNTPVIFQYAVGELVYVGAPRWTRAEKGIIQKRVLDSSGQPVYRIYFEGSNRHTQWVAEGDIHISYSDALERLAPWFKFEVGTPVVIRDPKYVGFKKSFIVQRTLNEQGKPIYRLREEPYDIWVSEEEVFVDKGLQKAYIEERKKYEDTLLWGDKPEPQLFCEEVRAPNHLVPRRDQYIEPVKIGGPSKPSNQTMESYMEKDLEQQSAQAEYEQERLANQAQNETEYNAYMETKAGELHDLNETQEILEMLLKAFRDDESKWALKVDEVAAQRNAVSRKTRLIENLLQDGEIKKRKIKHDLGIS